MVQIRQKDLRKRSFRRGFLGLLRFVLVSAFVPMLFVGRLWYSHQRLENGNGKKPHSNASTVAAFDVILNKNDEIKKLGSDVVELDHCNVHAALERHRLNFTSWATPLLEEAIAEFEKTIQPEESSRAQQEFVLELLEMFLIKNGHCDFELYLPLPPSPEFVLEERVSLIFSIVAFQDFDMLERLVEAIIGSNHVILIHLDKHVPKDYVNQVQQQLVERHTNVYLWQFGSIIYKTDSVSMINYRIMQWLTQEDVEYDYFVTLDGASFPLFSPDRLATEIQAFGRKVYLGETYRNGLPVHESQVAHLRQKRLLYTIGEQPLSKRLPRNAFADDWVPEFIHKVMDRKTNSGNQAIFASHVVRLLAESIQVRELFALSKYGCCCCLEENNWAAALLLVGLAETEILDQASTFQAWGGQENECGSSMKNAVLSEHDRQCFRLEDATLDNEAELKDGMYFWGNQTWSLLEQARDRGVLFARKFNSSDYSVHLLDKIKEQWHND